MIPFCIDQGIGLIPWSPLARGFFAGNHKQKGGGETRRAQSDEYAKHLSLHEENFAIAERVQEIARQRGVTGSQVALARLTNKPHITAPIIGATNLEHLDQAAAALEIQLGEDEVKKLEEHYPSHPIRGHLY